MYLSDLNINQKAEIYEINCDDILKNRFYSFGITNGTKVELTAKSLAKKTLEIKINNYKVALRSSEAANIRVKYAS
jgi:ferrous iron transport protein A